MNRTGNLLDEIVQKRRKSVERAKERRPLKELLDACAQVPDPASFLKAISVPGELSVIAEMKKASPSAGLIVKDYAPAAIAAVYEKSGARALSVLTEEEYFQGSAEHLRQARKASALPLLRKDFTVDPYQIYEARALGASAVLLILAALDGKQYAELLRLARDLKLEALVEVHSQEELARALEEDPRLVGVNNRDLRDLSVSLDTTYKLLERMPRGVCAVSESGIRSPAAIQELRRAGVRAALIGESILKSGDMGAQLRAFVDAGRD